MTIGGGGSGSSCVCGWACRLLGVIITAGTFSIGIDFILSAFERAHDPKYKVSDCVMKRDDAVPHKITSVLKYGYLTQTDTGKYVYIAFPIFSKENSIQIDCIGDYK